MDTSDKAARRAERPREVDEAAGRFRARLSPVPPLDSPPAPPLAASPPSPPAASGRSARRETDPSRRARQQIAAQRKFFTHAAVFAAVNLFLFITDVADGGNWWFFWPLLGWGIGLAAHAATTFGGAWEERKARQLTPTAVPAAPSGAPDHVEPAQLVEQAEARVAKLWRLARLIPSPPVRDQAFRVCAAADRIAEAMAANPPDAQTVRWFLERFLVPTEAVLDRYVRLATRDVPAAGPTLARVETHDLPLLEAKLDEFYERLHRGDLIDLEVASQMLAFDLEAAPPKPSRLISP